MTYLHTSAVLSEDRIYRYELERVWEYHRPTIAWVCLNPSTADENEDDPTLRKCIGFSKLWGYGALFLYNIFAYRATDPKKLRTVDIDIVGPDNNKCLYTIRYPLIAAWGCHGSFKYRGREVLGLLRSSSKEVWSFLTDNKNGTPRHPLMTPYSMPIRRLF